jgi:hypothetical protein
MSGFYGFSAGIEINLRTCRVFKDEELALWAVFENFKQVSGATGCHSAKAMKNRVNHQA